MNENSPAAMHLPQASERAPAAPDSVPRTFRGALSRWSIKSRLVAMVLAIALPLNAVILAVILHLAEAASEAQRESLRYTARSIAAGVDAQLGKYVALAHALSGSPALLDDDIAPFEAEARRAFVDIAQAWVLVADLGGQQIMNIASRPGAPLPRRPPQALAVQQRAQQSRSVVISDIWVGPVMGTWVAVVEVPIFKAGVPFRSMAVTMLADGFLDLLGETSMPRNWLAAVVDSQGRFIARVPDHERYVGQMASRGMQEAMTGESVREFRSLENDALIHATARPKAAPWAVGVAAKRTEIQAGAWEAVRWSAVTGVVLSLLSLLLAIAIARSIVRPIDALRGRTDVLLRDSTALPAGGPPEIRALGQAIAQSAAARRKHEDALAALKDRLAEEVSDLKDLHSLTIRLAGESDIRAVMKQLLRAVIVLFDAPKGSAQIALEDAAELELVADEGFDDAFRARFRRVTPGGESACADALRLRHRVIVEDVAAETGRAGLAEFLAPYGVRAAIATPVLDARDRVAAAFTVYFANPRRPTDRELRLLDAYGDVAMRHIEQARARARIAASESHLRLALGASMSLCFEWDVVNDRVRRLFSSEATFPETASGADTFENVVRAVHPEDQAAFQRSVRAALDSPDGHYLSEHRIVRPGGVVRWLSESGRVERDASGRPARLVGIARDVTAQRELFEQLHKTEQRYRTAFEVANVGKMEVDAASGRYSLVNEAYCAMTGRTREELLSLGPLDLAHPEVRIWDMPRVRALLRGDSDRYTAEKRIVRRDGRIVWVRVNASLVRDARGRPQHTVGVVEDITERRRAEAALRDSEERYRFLVETTSDMVFRIGLARPLPVDLPVDEQVDRILAEAFLIAANDGFARAYGFASADDVMGTLLSQIGPPTPADRATARAMVEAGHRIVDARSEEHDRDGRRRIRLISIVGRIENGAVIDWFGSARDITGRVIAEEALTASEERFRLAADATKTMVFVTDLASGDEATANIYGAENLIGEDARGEAITRGWWQNRIHPDDRSRHQDYFARCLADRECSRYALSYRVRHSDGTWRDVEAVGMIARAGDGSPARMIGTVIDVTERMQAQSALRASEQRLRLALDAGGMGSWVQRFDGGKNEADASLLTIMGLAETDWKEDPAILLGRVLPEDRPAIHEAIDRCARGEDYFCEFRVRLSDGRLRWVESHGRPEFDAAGRLSLIRGISADITRRIAVQENLTASERRFRRASDATRTLVYDTDLGGGTSGSAEAYGLEHVIGDDGRGVTLTSAWWHARIHPDDLPAHLEHLARSIATPNCTMYTATYRVRHSDGSWRDVEDVGQILRAPDGAAQRLIGAIMDVTERKRAEEALRRSEEAARLALDGGGMGAWTWDFNGPSVADDRTLALFGVARGTWAGDARLLLDQIVDQDRPAFVTAVAAAMKEGIYNSEFRVALADGGLRWLAGRGRVEFSEDGRPVLMRGINFDITERKERESRVALLIQEVNHRAKNMLALVQAIARQTAAGDPKEFVARFQSRIQALAANQDLLVRNEWRGVDMRDLALAQLAPFADSLGTRVVLSGPALQVTPPAAQTLGMALHELATNAAKYGALSNSDGHVDVAWRIEGINSQRRFHISWLERGGPPVMPKRRTGFGSTVVSTIARQSLKGEVRLDFFAEGLQWSLECSVANVVDMDGRTIDGGGLQR